MADLTPQIAAVAAVMDEIDQCRNPMPCELCRQRMQSVLDMGAAAERGRIRELARMYNAMYSVACHDEDCRNARHYVSFARLLDGDPS